jgi:hypothetical protein
MVRKGEQMMAEVVLSSLSSSVLTVFNRRGERPQLLTDL